eukprot:Nk52_evm27s294 gene=Nk52_evmTU27s294
MTAHSSSECEEIELLEKVLMRLAMCDTDEKLSKSVITFLPPVILKMASPHQAVKGKVMEILSHLNKRIKDQTHIQLPVTALVEQYMNEDLPIIMKNFTLIYLEMGFERLPTVEEKINLCALLLKSIRDKPVGHRVSIMKLLLPFLGEMKCEGTSSEEKRAFIGLPKVDSSTEFEVFLLAYLKDVLWLEASYFSAETLAGGQHPGLCTQSVENTVNKLKHVNGESGGKVTSETLAGWKLSVLKFLGGNELFAEADIFLHILVATCDLHHKVSSEADHMMRRMGITDFNTPKACVQLYETYLGKGRIPGQANVDVSKVVQPASGKVKVKVLYYLCKSEVAVNVIPHNVQTIFDSLYGVNVTVKLRLAGMEFIHWCCEKMSKGVAEKIGKVLLKDGLLKLIDMLKNESGEPERKLKGYAFIAVAKLSKLYPQIFREDIGIISKFFDAVAKEDGNVRISIQEGLSLLCAAYKNPEAKDIAALETLLLKSVEEEHKPQLRLAAVQFANALFELKDIPARYVCLLGAGDKKDEVKDEAMRGLRTKHEQDRDLLNRTGNDSEAYPDFCNLVLFLSRKIQERKEEGKMYHASSGVLPFTPDVYKQVLLFCKDSLLGSSGIKTAEKDVSLMRKYLEGMYSKSSTTNSSSVPNFVQAYHSMLETAFSPAGGGDLQIIAAESLVDLSSCLRAEIGPVFGNDFNWMKPFIFSPNKDVRDSVAHFFGLISEFVDEATIGDFLKEILEFSSPGKENLEKMLGSISCLGYILGYALGIGSTNLNTEVLKKGVFNLFESLSSSNASVSCAGCNAIGNIGRRALLPLSAGNIDEKGEYNVDTLTTHGVTERLMGLLKSKEVKILENAASSLGMLGLFSVPDEHKEQIMKSLLALNAEKNAEAHYTIGEALVYIACGLSAKDSIAEGDYFLKERAASVRKGRESDSTSCSLMKTLLETVLLENAVSGNPAVRRSACIWLLSILGLAGDHEGVQPYLQDIQIAFSNLLGDVDEVTQEMASKGLSLVYDSSSSEMKKELVSALVDTLTTGESKKKAKGKLAMQRTEDTKMFADGALGKSPDGSSLSTYKELCSLVTEMNQPDLIYKFMSLSSYHSKWNSRKGAAFGFSTIAMNASEELQPFLPTLIPKLYRYQFDPQVKVRDAMSNIWKIIVPDVKKTLDKFLEPVLNDLINGLGSNLWRVRESSCLALKDLVNGRQWEEKIHKRLDEIWELALRVLDDVKETVRTAAESLCKTLSNYSINLFEHGSGTSARSAAGKSLSVLLTKGISSNVKEVRGLSLETILKMSKHAGPLIKPHTTDLVMVLLESLSSLENQAMNYLSLNADKYDVSVDHIDSARISASKMSPMMQAIDMCVTHVDESVLVELVPRLIELIRKGIGVATKAGCAKFVGSVAQQCPQDLQPYSKKLANALFVGIKDRSPAVSKAYTPALARILRIADESTVLHVFDRLKGMYLDTDDVACHLGSGAAALEISRSASDVFKGYYADILPLCFVASCDEDADVRSVWKEVWEDNTPGTRAGTCLYAQEIIELTYPMMDSQSWSTKKQAAECLETLASNAGSALESHTKHVVPILMKGLSGRLWDGKHILLKALSSTVMAGKNVIPFDSGDFNQVEILKVLCRESKKKKREYKLVAIESFGMALEAFSNPLTQNVCDSADEKLKNVAKSSYMRLVNYERDLSKASDFKVFNSYYQVIMDILLPPEDNDSDSDEEDKALSLEKKKIIEEIDRTCFSTLAALWPSSMHSAEFMGNFKKSVDRHYGNGDWKTKVNISNALLSFLWVVDKMSLDSANAALEHVLNVVCKGGLSERKYTAVRASALACLATYLFKVSAVPVQNIIKSSLDEFKTDIVELKGDSDGSIRELASFCLDEYF